MKTHFIILALLVLLSSQLAFSHGDHDHELITEDAAKSLALSVAKELSSRDTGVAIGQLPASWALLPLESTAMHKVGKGYYIVAVENRSENKTLYILMSNTGDVYDGNFSGVFEGLN